MSQRKELKKLIIAYCNKIKNRTFTLKQLNKEYGDYSVIDIGGNTPDATVRRLLQELQNKEGIINFVNNRGRYTLTDLDLLDCEKQELSDFISVAALRKADPNKREYHIETYARDLKWVKQARNKYGDLCMLNKCKNTFVRPDKSRYIEVHHIIPLHEGGEDHISNLSVLCAHHHRMAHFAEQKSKDRIRDELLEKVG